jgi:coenzyme F420-reducing hydrogenase delta subunit/ferredoxin
MAGDRPAVRVDAATSWVKRLPIGLGRSVPGPDDAESGRPLAERLNEVHLDRTLRAIERGYLYFDRLLRRVLPEPLNPFLQTGAIAITALVIATVTGVVLLLWYRPSVHMAYLSITAMSEAPWTAGLLRSLHRYSSDACMFFGMVHALRSFFERRFAGPRWLAWVTGVASLGILWFVGWTGYWLVWDERAHHVAIGTARALDVIPIFADPMGRSFLTNEGVNSLLFFVVFFFHMLIPLAIVFTLWLHLARLSRPHFMTRTPMTIWVLGSLLLLSIAYPAVNAEPASMTALGGRFGMDWWYLLPIALTDRLAGGAIWATFLLGGAFLGSMPLWLTRGRREPAFVTSSRCNACARCYQDCPYDAVSMVPRTDGSERYPVQAEVDPSKCVGCGICSGSCDSIAIGVDWFRVEDQRSRIEAWVQQSVEAGESPHLAVVCSQSAGANLNVDPESGICDELPGYRVLEVPCAGWLHALTVERALRRGAAAAVVVACGPGECGYREGPEWLRERMDGLRPPVLRVDLVDRERVHLLELDRTQRRELVRRALALRNGGAERESAERSLPRPSRTLAGAASVVLAVLVAALLGVVSDLGYAAPDVDGSELVVTFKHPGRVGEDCRELTPDEQAKRPVHMRQERICDRERAPVRLRVALDGEPVIASLHPPAGLWGDGNSVAVTQIPVSPGEHVIRVEIGDSLDPDEWTYLHEQTLNFTPEARRVIAFDRLSGFTAH